VKEISLHCYFFNAFDKFKLFFHSFVKILTMGENIKLSAEDIKKLKADKDRAVKSGQTVKK